MHRTMPRIAFSCTLILTGVCSTAASQNLPAPILLRTTYISVTDADTVWQNIIRTPQSFESDVRIPGAGALVKIAAVLDSVALIRRLNVDVWRGTGSPNPSHSQSASFIITHDSVLGEVHDPTRTQPQRFPAPRAAMIVQGAYLAFLEQLLLRARALGAGEVSIPLYFFGTPGQTGVATVRFSEKSDSAIVVFAGHPIALRVDDWGRIVSGETGRTRISRVRFRQFFPDDPNSPA